MKSTPRTPRRQNTPRPAKPAARKTQDLDLAHARRLERDAVLRRFGYDPDASVAFVLERSLPLPGPVLDIGTGKGRFAVALAQYCPEVTTVDLSASEQRFARMEATYQGVENRIRFLARDAAMLPWSRPRFGAVVSMNAFHHMEEPDFVFAEMLRVLLPGGVLVLADFSASGFAVMDKIHRAEGRTHPHPPSRLRHWRTNLLERGFRLKSAFGCHQHVIVAQSPAQPAPTPSQ